MDAVLSPVGHGAFGLRTGLRSVVDFFSEPGGMPQTFAEVRLGHPVQASEWAADSGAYAAPFYLAVGGVPLDVVAVETSQRALVRVESVAGCVALEGSYYYPSQPTAHGAWDSGELWDGGGLWDRGSFVYVNATAAERAATMILRCPVGYGTDAVALPLLGRDLLTDGSFETWVDATDPTYWDQFNSLGGASTFQATTPVQDGAYSVLLTSNLGGSRGVRQDSIAALVGATYCLSGYYYCSSLISSPSLSLWVADSGGTANTVQSDGRTYVAASPVTIAADEGQLNEWRRFAFYFRANATSLRVQVQAGGFSTWYVDNFRLQRVYRWLRHEPRLIRAPNVSEARRDKFFGPWQVGASRLELANDGSLETTLGALDVVNAEVLVRVGGRFPGDSEEITPEALRTSYVGRVTEADVSEASASLELEDARGLALAQLPRRIVTEQGNPQADPRIFGTERPMLWGFGEDMPARRIDKTAGGLGVYEVADCDDWASGIGVDHAATARYAEVRMFADEDAAQRGDLSLSTDVTDHVTFAAATGRFTATKALKPVPVDEEHQFYSFSINGGAQIDCRVLDANEETVLLTPTGTGADNNFSAVGAPTIWEAVATVGDSARADSTSTSGTRRCEVTCSAISGSAAVAYVELTCWAKTKGGDPEDGDTCRLYVNIGGTRYYGTLVDEPHGPSFREYRFKWELDPSTAGAWTEAQINSARWGMEYGPNGVDYMVIDTLIPEVRRYKSSPATASRPSIRSPYQFAAALQQAMLTAAALTADLTVEFDEATFKFTVTGDGAVTTLTLYTKTGRQKSGWAALGYGTDADKTGSLVYTADNAYYDATADLDAAVLRVRAMGYVDDASGTYTGIAGEPIEKGPDVLRFLLERNLGVPASRLDASSFATVRATAPWLAVFLQQAEGVEQIIERIETGDLADLTLDDERYYYQRRASAWATGGVELHDRDFIEGLSSSLSSADVYGILRVLWGPSGLSAEESATDSGVRYGRSDVREWRTYLTLAGDASDALVALAADAVVARRYKLAARGQLLRVRPGQIVRLNPVTGGLADSAGAYSPVDVRILSREIDYQTQIVTATAVEV